ncbi:hypothetical protein [Microbacterium sp. NIBRBAC000506063]|uniref:hypothetical protein n=1 Tax=Microbacterium sp. NIBRBAC000506063 TaxID=2734618 RepID=UPI001BB4B6A8|nr:hypothetical protein [Microbacterium sp. NIBRBAC000506063]QTV80323.1 hypothetical protein KAE78_04955 [Microbacterium sp. NIBRBAC000506063]
MPRHLPGYTLTEAEQLTTIGVRLVYVENPDRAQVLADLYDVDPAAALAAPQVGTGVTRSIPTTARSTWSSRSVTSDATRPTPTRAGRVRIQRRGDNGVVHNSVRASGYLDGELLREDVEGDELVITDVPLTTTTQKTWTGGPLAVPARGRRPRSTRPAACASAR